MSTNFLVGVVNPLELAVERDGDDFGAPAKRREDVLSCGSGLEVVVAGHDDFENGVSADLVADVNEAVSEFENRRLIDEEDAVQSTNGHTSALSALKTSERPFCVRNFINGSRTEQRSAELTSISSGEH